MKKFFKLFNPNIEEGVRLISIATSIRWFGWGFAEAFLPIFLFSFAHTYAETGLLRSIYGVVFLLSLPMVSWLADNIASKKLLIVSLLLYPFISISYFSAGVFGVIAFIVCARIINGVAYALDGVGRATYVRTHAKPENIATSFGYMDSLANFWWLVAIFISAILVRYIPIHYLFLMIAPTSLIAIYFVRKLPDGLTASSLTKEARLSVFGSYGSFFKTIISWGRNVRWLAVFYLFIDITATVGEFFIPIYAFTQHQSLWQIVLLTGFAAFPALFSSPLGLIADKYKHTIFWTCGFLTVFLFLLAFIPIFPAQLVLVFLIGSCLQLLGLSVDREITLAVPKEHIGTLSGAFEGVSQVAEITGPIVLGIMIDLSSMRITLSVLAVISIIFAVIYFNFNKKNEQNKI